MMRTKKGLAVLWNDMLDEVLNDSRDDQEIDRVTEVSVAQPQVAATPPAQPKSKSNKRKRYYLLGEKYRDVYFTKRETETMVRLLDGLTVAEIARILNLSTRTVEFYVKNLRLKLKCPSKNDLISKIAATDFLKNVAHAE